MQMHSNLKTDTADAELPEPEFRLVTRSDFDGLVCAVLLKHLNLIDDIKFVHPKDMQDGKIDITGSDITTNLPYVPGAHLVFDHHLSETIRNTGNLDNHAVRGPCGVEPLWRLRDLPGGLGRDNGGRGQGRCRAIQPG